MLKVCSSSIVSPKPLPKSPYVIDEKVPRLPSPNEVRDILKAKQLEKVKAKSFDDLTLSDYMLLAQDKLNTFCQPKYIA